MSLDKRKCDPELGKRVHEYLVSIGMETPIEQFMINGMPASVKDRITSAEGFMKQFLEVIGLDLTDDSMCDTPTRVAKMYISELCYGIDYQTFPKCTVVSNSMQYDDMVLEKQINITSLCEHHLQPITGTATIAYIPGDLVLGLSKLNRVSDYFARRPQVQERLTGQIYHALSYVLKTEDIAVLIDAEHGCVKNRGIRDQCSHTVTNKLGGGFRRDPALRAEFMSIATSR